MKWSIYNELVHTEDAVCLFNPLRGKHLVLSPELSDWLAKCDNDINFIAESHPQLYKCLETERFVVSEECDEVGECIEMLNRRFSSKTNLVVTINPTLDCNLKCWYCYESHVKGSCMQPNVIDSVVRFIEKQVQSDELETLQLSFFGGEPLLKYEKVVKPIVERCNELCLDKGKKFRLNVTSNGVCLTPKVTEELLSMGIIFGVQVAFDGGREMHDAVKHFPNGRGSYDRVKRNLSYAIEKGILTTIRCNYTKSNIDSFGDLLADFRMYWPRPNVRFSFHKVWQEPESGELSRKRRAFKSKIEGLGLHSNVNTFYGDSLNPCYADFVHNVVINYNGDVFRCTARDFKPEHRLGYFDDSGVIKYNDDVTKNVTSRLTGQCYDCRLLPICTICFQQRNESAAGICPNPQMRENAAENLKRYFYDVTKRKQL